MSNMKALAERQGERNDALLKDTQFLGDEVASDVLGLHIDIATTEVLGAAEDRALTALQIESACTAIRALASLAEIGELDHLGGGLELIPGLLMTLSVADYDRRTYTIEHAHTSIGYYSALAAFGFVEAEGRCRAVSARAGFSRACGMVAGGNTAQWWAFGGDDSGGCGAGVGQEGVV